MRATFILIAVSVLAVSSSSGAGLAEKVSEDENFVVYRIPVRALGDLQSDATGHHEGYELSPSYGRSSSKSSSHSKSSSSSTGTGKGKGYGEGSLSKGYGEGSSGGGHGYGSGGHGYGSGGSGYGSGGSGYGSGGQGYGSGGHGYGSGGSGYGSGGQGYGSGGHGYGSGGSGQGYGGSYRGGYSPSYGPSYSPSYGPSHGPGYDSAPHYDDEEGGDDGPAKVITTTKTVTTNSAHDTGLDKLKEGRHHQYRQPSDSLGDIRFKLADYLKNTPGHELSKYFEAAQSELNPGYRSGHQGFNVNEFTRTLNQGMGQAAAFTSPSYRNNRFLPQASIIIPKAYAFRHSGFGLPGF